MYETYHSDVVTNNFDQFKYECDILAGKIISERLYTPLQGTKVTGDSARDDHVNKPCYMKYNIWSIVGASDLWWKFYSDICSSVRQYCGHDRPLWMRAWLNVHQYDEVLDWHDHRGILYHGYASIDPKDSYTEFDNYRIDNTCGKIYIGPGEYRHRVVCKPFAGYRYTLAFDIIHSSRVVDYSGNDRHVIVPVAPRVL